MSLIRGIEVVPPFPPMPFSIPFQSNSMSHDGASLISLFPLDRLKELAIHILFLNLSKPPSSVYVCVSALAFSWACPQEDVSIPRWSKLYMKERERVSEVRYVEGGGNKKLKDFQQKTTPILLILPLVPFKEMFPTSVYLVIF